MKKLLCLAALVGLSLVSCNIAAAQGPAASAEPAPPAKTEVAPAPRDVILTDSSPVTAAGSKPQASTVAGGVKGRVYAAPSKDSKGALPVAALVIVKDQRGIEFKRVRTDADGNYVLDVPPSPKTTYTVEVYPDADWLAPATVKVILTRTEHFKVDFHYKTR